MKTFFILLLSATVSLAADSQYINPTDVLKDNGVLVISDGSSFYAFKTNGAFDSFPVGISGRCFEGNWTMVESQPGVFDFTVVAKLSWMNGTSSLNEYRRIVFKIYEGGHKKTISLHDIPSGIFYSVRPKEMYDGYFFIDELTKIQAPSK